MNNGSLTTAIQNSGYLKKIKNMLLTLNCFIIMLIFLKKSVFSNNLVLPLD
jgi:hypothetical protein